MTPIFIEVIILSSIQYYFIPVDQDFAHYVGNTFAGDQSGILPYGSLFPNSEYILVLRCYSSCSTGASFTARQIREITPGVTPPTMVTLAPGQTISFRSFNPTTDPALRTATGTFTVAPSSTSYFYFSEPGRPSGTLSSSSNFMAEPCMFKGNWFYATASISTVQTNVTASLTSIGAVAASVALPNQPVAIPTTLNVISFDGITSDARLVRVAVQSYSSNTEITGHVGYFTLKNTRCSTTTSTSKRDRIVSGFAPRYFSFLGCLVGAKVGQSDRFFATFEVSRQFTDTTIQNATFSYVDPIVLTPGGAAVPVQFNIGVDAIVKAPANAKYPVTLMFTKPGGYDSDYNQNIAVRNIKVAGCSSIATTTVALESNQFNITLACENQVAHLYWQASEPDGPAQTLMVAAVEASDTPVIIQGSINSTVLPIVAPGDGSLGVVRAIVQFPQPTFFTFTTSVNTGSIDKECTANCISESCSSLPAAASTEIRMTTTSTATQLISFNITAAGRSQCSTVPVGHICSDFLSWIPTSGLPRLAIANDSLNTLSRSFANASSTCRETIRRTVCLSAAKTCAASGAEVPNFCREQCIYDVKTGCPELPPIFALSACPYSNYVPVCEDASNPLLNPPGTTPPSSSSQSPSQSGSGTPITAGSPAQPSGAPNAASAPGSSNTSAASSLAVGIRGAYVFASAVAFCMVIL